MNVETIKEITKQAIKDGNEEKLIEIQQSVHHYFINNQYHEFFLLNVSDNQDEINSAIKKHLRSLAAIFHPDKNPTRQNWANTIFSEINKMIEVLGNEEERKQLLNNIHTTTFKHYTVDEVWEKHKTEEQPKPKSFDFSDLSFMFGDKKS